jgi:aminoglycoside 6'-N-acetyltransferase I
MHFTIHDLDKSDAPRIEAAARLLHLAFSPQGAWTTMAEAMQEVVDSLGPDRISRVAIDTDGSVLGWIGAINQYDGLVWELHPIVVTDSHRARGAHALGRQ